MANNKYTFKFGSIRIDMSDPTDIDLEELNMDQMLELYNQMVVQIQTKVRDYDSSKLKERASKWRSKEDAVAAIASLHSSMIAFAKGERGEDEVEEAKPRKRRERKAESGDRKPRIDRDTSIITVNEDVDNERRFKNRPVKYRTGMTVQSFVDKFMASGEGKSQSAAMSRVKRDVEKGFISLSAE